jgi:hypothetical protein
LAGEEEERNQESNDPALTVDLSVEKGKRQKEREVNGYKRRGKL